MSTQLLERPQEQKIDNTKSIKHLENPATPDKAYCGAKLKVPVASPRPSEQCVVCLDLAMAGRFIQR